MKRAVIFVTLAALLLLSAAGLSDALADGPDYTLGWWTVDGGGAGFSTGGGASTSLSTGYSLGGTIGQPDTGSMSGGDYTLFGGFWRKVVVPISYWYKIYLPLIFRNW